MILTQVEQYRSFGYYSVAVGCLLHNVLYASHEPNLVVIFVLLRVFIYYLLCGSTMNIMLSSNSA